MAETDTTQEPATATTTGAPEVAPDATPAAENLPHGVVQHCFDSGLVCCEMPYERGVLQGEGRMYYTTGGLYAVENYARNMLNGLTTLYYPNGVLQAELEYVDGLLEGTIKEYFPTGRLESVSEYRRNKKNGVSLVYDETGTLVTRETYVDDSLSATETTGEIGAAGEPEPVSTPAVAAGTEPTDRTVALTMPCRVM